MPPSPQSLEAPGGTESPTASIELADRQILNVIQSSFPLTDEPFHAIGQEVGLSAGDVIERIGRLKRQNVVRQISAIFDTRRLGYKTSLVACSYPSEDLHKAALDINTHPGVSHNYAREGHDYNLWFTLAVPPYEDLEESVTELARRTGAAGYRLLPTIRFFKIGVNFDMVKQEGAAFAYNPDNKDWNKVEPVTEFEVQAIRELQEDLPLDEQPFRGMAERLDMAPPGALRSGRGPSTARRHAAVQRRAAPPAGRLQVQRHVRVARPAGAGGRGGRHPGGVSIDQPLL